MQGGDYSGLHHITLPKDDEADLIKLPESVRNEMTVTLAESLPQVLKAALADPPEQKQAA